MSRLFRMLGALGFASAVLAGAIWLAGEPVRAALPQAQTTSQTLQYPPLFFREDWKLATGLPNINRDRADEPEHTVGQGDIANANLELRLYGDQVGPVAAKQTYNHDITYVMTLLCTTNCAIALRDKNNDVDLSGLATIRWRTKVSGFHQLHPILKLADGTWIVGDHATTYSTDWVESEIQLEDVRWRPLNIQDVVEGDKWVEKPNLSRVEEIGFTELMRGAGHGGAGSRIDWIEVYGKPVSRVVSGTASSSR